MTAYLRIALCAVLTGMLTSCGTIYIDQPAPAQPAPIPVNPQPVVYPSQPQSAQVPAPIQTPPLPPSVPSKAPVAVKQSSAVRQPPAVIPVQPIKEDTLPNSDVVPARAPGSISELPDPS